MFDPRHPDYANTPTSAVRPQYGYITKNPNAAPYVSIITPFFNTGEVFQETARSVLSQSFQQWEWVIVNDGSHDPVAIQLLERYRASDPRIRVVDHPLNRGLPSARNTGFKNARADFLFYLDSDDLIEPTTIEKCLWYLETHAEHGFVKGYTVCFGAQEVASSRGFSEGAGFRVNNHVTMTAMVRRTVIEHNGGFDPDLRQGMEDWHFWLSAANCGFWGGTIPEYLDWYRKRPAHHQRWESWNQSGVKRFRTTAKKRFPTLWDRGGFPKPTGVAPKAFQRLELETPFQNLLQRQKERTLFIIPWMEIGGADRVNIDWIRGLTENGHEVTLCSTLASENLWAAQFYALTPDVFVLPNFLNLEDVPRFLAYVIASRQIANVVIANSILGYQLIPFLRSRFPDVTYIDITHAEEPNWLSGGYPRFGIGYQDLLDLNITSTKHLHNWMIERGADAERVAVCYTGAPADLQPSSADKRTLLRRKLGLPSDKTIIVFAGRLGPQKRPLVVVEVLRRLYQLGDNFFCVFIGDGELRLPVEKTIKKRALGNAVFLAGAISHAKCLEYFMASDIFFLPSAYEGISVALYEAMAIGLVPVVSKVGGHDEVISPKCGFSVAIGSNEIDQYVAALRGLISSPEIVTAMDLQLDEELWRIFHKLLV
jgi:glycosyltransferase involved in cell wall biosynthesis